MPQSAEITYAIQNDRPSITIHLSEEGNSTPDLCGMLSQIQEAITEFQVRPQTKQLSCSDVDVQDVSRASPTAPKTQALPSPDNNGKNYPQKYSPRPNANSPSSGRKMISESQIATIRQNLQERNISEYTFCNAHGVKRIEDLPAGVAWHVIHYHTY